MTKPIFDNEEEAKHIIGIVRGNSDLDKSQLLDLFKSYKLIKKTPLEEARAKYKAKFNGCLILGSPEEHVYIEELEKENERLKND